MRGKTVVGGGGSGGARAHASLCTWVVRWLAGVRVRATAHFDLIAALTLLPSGVERGGEREREREEEEEVGVGLLTTSTVIGHCCY